MLRKAIVAATRHMCELYDLSGGVDHDGEKGAFREFFITQLVRPLLPFHYGVGSGVVVDRKGQQGRQSDLIIYDRRRLPPILCAGDRAVFPIDSVLRVIEVKSELKASHYTDMVDAARRLSPPSKKNPKGLEIAIPGRLQATSGGPATIWPLYSLFAYTSDAPNRDEAERLKEKDPDGMHYVKLVGVLDKGVWWLDDQNVVQKYLDASRENVVVEYMKVLLNRLEEAADSRGKYRLQDWLR